MSTQEPTNQYDRRKSKTKHQLREALARLRAGTPLNEAVRGRKWKLDLKTLAEEAGISRNAIYQNHAEIIEELRTTRAGQGQSGANSTTNETKRLKRRLKEVETEQRLVLTENAELLARAQRAENELEELRPNRGRRTRPRDESAREHGGQRHENVMDDTNPSDPR